MNYELLKPDTSCEQLRILRQELQNILELKKKSLKTAPQGHLRIAQAKKGKKIQFYHFTNPKDLKGKYIPHSKLNFAQKLAQKDYDEKLIKLLQKQITLIEKYLAINENKINELYTKMSYTRQQLVKPVTLTDSLYIKEWLNTSWQKLLYQEEHQVYTSANGEQVRSKSEVIIADTLKRMNIPYRYEYPLELKDGRTFYPDFLCLNVRTRKEYYWEHFGMMDDQEYLERTIQKLKLYSENKIFPGKNLIITMESQAYPLNVKQIENLVKEFLQ